MPSLDDWRARFDKLVEELECRLFHHHDHTVEPIAEVQSIPLAQLRRQWIYDFHIDDPEDFANQLGLPPYSQEGADHERTESDRRLARISGLVPLLVEQGTWMATVMVQAGVASHDIDPLQADAALINYRHLFVHNLMSLTATLADLGVLNVER